MKAPFDTIGRSFAQKLKGCVPLELLCQGKNINQEFLLSPKRLVFATGGSGAGGTSGTSGTPDASGTKPTESGTTPIDQVTLENLDDTLLSLRASQILDKEETARIFKALEKGDKQQEQKILQITKEYVEGSQTEVGERMRKASLKRFKEGIRQTIEKSESGTKTPEVKETTKTVEAKDEKVDGVTGATFSSRAIIKNVQLISKKAKEKKIK